MKSNQFFSLFSLILFLLSPGCREEMPVDQPVAVIEGVFDSNGYPEVIFSRSVVPSKEGELRESVIRWGKVTISDGSREVVLTGSPDSRYLPPFRYHTLDMRGEAGKSYTITARFGDLYARSTCRMPAPTVIDSVVIQSTEIDTLKAATLFFTSPPDVPAYYYLSMRQPGGDMRRLPCMMGTLKADLPGRSYYLPVLRPRTKIDNGKYKSQLIAGEEWIITLNRVEREVYEFWKAYDNMILFSSSPFLNSSESLPTNVAGGYGVWSPQGSSSIRIQVSGNTTIKP